MLMSVERADRTGPTGVASVDWNTAASLVMPPSTSSSNTTSASLIPLCGRAALELSILTTSATRLVLVGSGASTPVSGNTGGAVVVVVVGGRAGTVLVVGRTLATF